MSILVAVIVILVILALLLYLVPLVITEAPMQRVIKAVLIVAAVLFIVYRAGLLK